MSLEEGGKMDEGKIYKIVCPHCRKDQHACKSMYQKMGNEAGIGRCLYCDKLNLLIFRLYIFILTIKLRIKSMTIMYPIRWTRQEEGIA